MSDAAQVLAEARRLTCPILGAIDEIEAAQQRHPGAAGRIAAAYQLLAPTHELMRSVEMTYRGHCRELLERVANGTDTRPGTAAEICIGLSYASLAAPLNETGAGLYHRMWALAFPDCPMPAGGDYEWSAGSLIDEAEAGARRKLAQPDRRLP